MRFFAANPADGDRTGNLPAGTVVDTKVSGVNAELRLLR